MTPETQIPFPTGLIAAIDAGGTTFKCAIYDSSKGIIERLRVPTAEPDQTLPECIAFFKQHRKTHGQCLAMGIGTFGPLDIDETSPNYGLIGKSPKPVWSNVNLKSVFENALNCPVAIDTDVNAALLAELRLGAAKSCRSAAYTTIGTGIGSGFFANGDFLGKPYHPEFGHIRVSRHKDDAEFEGVCDIHVDCLEGLASAPALTARYGDPKLLGEDHKAWDLMGFYLAQACMTQFLTFRPERIILGGGIMLSPYILGNVHEHFINLLGDYLEMNMDRAKTLIVKPELGDDAGLWGAITLAANLMDF